MTSPHPQDAIEFLLAEHQAIQALLAEYRALGHEVPSACRKALAEQICMELTIHGKLKEELFYPALRDALHQDLLDEAELEHAGCRDLIGQILAMGSGDALYHAKMTVLAEQVEHHLREEAHLFAQARKCGLDLGKLGRRLAERRTELEVVSEALREEALVAVIA
ncbi:hemerythrin domain-containing protein [Ramlibacter tataouinensis]|uniref:Hemerythrin-like domain-containing protein n=1 Tax=Ramlibacter tataouinensis (strain ATCC BAA-407 / DSM 14655 / LMG 21543 / TTB310) TaxID=365046 RepID=F5Y2M5_RAMTT|nr:hemerythrin domain-containing protein [Ramlibacter tataouinensis]AEG92388.1 conserved hypothetical protein [Ramlibacter tataouinensis TTB310]